MKRWLFNLAASVSLLLSLAAAAGWAMSYARPLARSPQLGGMRDAVAYRPAIRARAATDRPRDAHELGSHLTAGEAHLRVAVTAHVYELEMRRKLRVREGAGALEVEAFRVFKARADTMP